MNINIKELSSFARSLSANEVAIGAIIVWSTYLFGLIVYRLYLCPVAHIPGPFLAKVTYWHEFYYDCIQTGQYTFVLPTLHTKYGPIIRINPHEVHIADPDFYDTVFAGATQKRNKWPWYCNAFGSAPESAFATSDHDLHRKRRAALNPYFSKTKVRSLQPVIEERAEALCKILEEFQSTGEIMKATLGFAAATNDIAMQYAFGRSENRVEAPDFDPSFHDASVSGISVAHLSKHFPWILNLMMSLPDKASIVMNPNMFSFIKLKRVSRIKSHKLSEDVLAQLEIVKANPENHKYNADSYPTIFHELLHSSLPPAEKSTTRLADDGQSIVVAGTLTTAGALACALFYLLSQPPTLRRLKEELIKAIPDPKARVPSLATLEQLPYLTSVIKEALRISNGVSTRLQRISPVDPVVFKAKPADGGKEYVIPPGTPMSLTHMLIHFDGNIFADPYAFRPERWIENPKLDRHLHPFSGGTRQCVGINLAWAELYLVLAMIFRRYGGSYGGWKELRWEGDKGVLELFETSEKDIRIVADLIVPLTSPESKGVRIVVRE
ncbi:cytochrome P450 [Glonium stellatum]|uniref:Cytochrome P450 n=1 Tax=Glonium stellatum TaxID=574774 RepID=A0A8E2FA91_9PEZI|nr:cytochrome P450 [Glonium stellatum]